MDANNESFENLFKQEETRKIRHFTPGQKVKATIIAVSGESAFLDVGGKSEGVLASAELKDENGQITAVAGDRIDVYFLRFTGAEMVFTARLGSGSGSEQFEEAWRSGIPVEGLVKAEVKGGFEITLGGNVRAFCPFSQIGLRRVADPATEYIGNRLPFRITRFDEAGRNIVVSARAIQEEERQAQREELKKTLMEGDIVDGEISSIQDFGAFVDLGGVDGLIPISEVGWTRIDNLTEFFTLGQKVKVMVKKLDWDTNRISLSFRETQPDPWTDAATRLPEGSTQRGVVSRLAQFGAFVTLAEGIDGLLHISKLGGGRRINHPREVLEAGQEIDVVIESVDTEEKRISLAPVDYQSAEQLEEVEKADYVSYVRQKKVRAQDRGTEGVGSFGALLKAKMKEKKK
ncbi:MAG: 30S ribosomal protein S1 [Desulfopila sp.]